MTKNFTITSAIFNEIQELDFSNGEVFEEKYHIIRELAKHEAFGDTSCIDTNELEQRINDEINSIISVNMIATDGLLYNALIRWYNRNETHSSNDYSLKVLENVRSAVIEDGYLYYVTGCGYDTIDSDLLGGSADGATRYKFLEWINN